MGRTAAFGAITIGSLLILASLTPAGDSIQTAGAKRVIHGEFGGFHRVSNFRFIDVPFRSDGERKMATSKVSLSGGTIAAISANRFVVIDEDSGALVVTDGDGNKLASHQVRAGAGLLAVDNNNNKVFVVDRVGDRVWKLSIDDDSKISHERRVATPAEPFGVALTPDGATLLVTTVADRKLVAYDADKLEKKWTLSIPAEARGVAVSPDGKEAVVTHLTTGSVTHVNLKTRKLGHTALNVSAGAPRSVGFTVGPQAQQALTSGRRGLQVQNASPRRTTSAGSRFARNAFAATYMPGGITAIAYQESTPQQVAGGSERVGTYGGGFEAPINHRIAFIGDGEERRVVRAEIAVHQPRAIVYDDDNDTLYLAALGNDQILAISNASTPSAQFKWSVALPRKNGLRCGPNGMAMGTDGQLRAFCSLSRRVVTVKEKVHPTHTTQTAAVGDELTKSLLSKKALLGKQLFHQGSDFRLSTQGAMACSSCHPEGRTDGLSWRIEGHSLQTPLLIGGRLLGTHPFKWDGKDSDLTTSLTNTVRRLGGNGINKEEVKYLKAFFATMPKPRTPTADRKAVARGEKLFRSRALGCDRCHSGKAYTNGKSYELSDDLGKVDTPSLIGLASSAPYYHDGSASNLRALLFGKGDIHGMGGIDRIKSSQFDDLVAFLESLVMSPHRLFALVAASATAFACSPSSTSHQPVSAQPDATEEASATPTALPVGWTEAKMARSVPHGHRVANVLVAPSGSAAVTIDQSQEIRIWPRLDGSVEPVDPGMRRVSDAAMARGKSGLVLSTLDTIGVVQISSVTDSGEVAKVFRSKAGSPAQDVVVLPVSGLTAILAGDRSVEVRGADGTRLARYDRRGFQPVQLYVAGPDLIGALEADPGSNEVKLTLHLLRVTLKPSPSIERVGEPHELVVKGSLPTLSASSLGPAGKRFAVATLDPAKAELKLALFDLEAKTNQLVSFGAGTVAPGLALGFVDANHLVAAFPTGAGTWSIDARSGRSSAMPTWSNPAQAPRAVSHGGIVSSFGVGLHVYDAKTRDARFLTYRSFFPTHGAVSPSGQRFLYSSGADAYLFDSKTDTLLTRKWDLETLSPKFAAFVDEDTILFVSHYGAMRLMHRQTGEVLDKMSGAGGTMSVDFDPISKRVLIVPRFGEVWVSEIVEGKLKGPYVVSDNGFRSGFLSGSSALWTVDGMNVVRTYTMDEIRDGVTRERAVGRGKRLGNAQPLALTRSGSIIISYYAGSQRLARLSENMASFGAASFDGETTPNDAKRMITVDFKAKRPSASIVASSAFVSPDGTKLAVAGQASLNLYDADTFKLLWSHPAPQSVSTGISWDRHSNVVGVQSGNGIAFFNATSGKPVHASCGPVFVTSDDDPPPTLDGFAGSICTGM